MTEHVLNLSGTHNTCRQLSGVSASYISLYFETGILKCYCFLPALYLGTQYLFNESARLSNLKHYAILVRITSLEEPVVAEGGGLIRIWTTLNPPPPPSSPNPDTTEQPSDLHWYKEAITGVRSSLIVLFGYFTGFFFLNTIFGIRKRKVLIFPHNSSWDWLTNKDV